MTSASNGPAGVAMILMPKERVDRWQHLVTVASLLDESPPERSAAEARGLLHSVLEVFPQSIEPADDFEAYAVRRLAASLLRALAASKDG